MTVRIALYSRSQREKAMQLVARAETWAEGVRPRDGLRFNLFASESAPGVVYQTHLHGLGCTCPGARRSARGRCFHMLACQIVTERVQDQAARPRVSYENLYGNDEAF